MTPFDVFRLPTYPWRRRYSNRSFFESSQKQPLFQKKLLISASLADESDSTQSDESVLRDDRLLPHYRRQSLVSSARQRFVQANENCRDKTTNDDEMGTSDSRQESQTVCVKRPTQFQGTQTSFQSLEPDANSRGETCCQFIL